MRFILPIIIGFAVRVEAAYDDTRRLSCLRSLASLDINEDIAMAYETGMQMLELEKTSHHLTLQTAFPDDSSAQNYKQACEKAGGIFVSFTGTIDCEKDGITNMTSTTITVNEGECFTAGPECQHYVNIPEDWQLDTNQVFQKVCTVRDETLEEVYDGLISSTTSMPAGEPIFVDHSASYRGTRQSSCMDAFREVLFSNDDLTGEALHHAGKTDVKLLQMNPYIVQGEYYNDDDDSRIETYRELCKESGGSFATFNGVLDCLGVGTKNKGVKLTTVFDSAATCFPATGCTGYTLGQWKVDTTMKTARYSCTIRSSAESSEDDTNSDKDDGEADPSKSNTDDETGGTENEETKNPDKGGNIAALMIIFVAISVVLIGTVVSSRRRNTTQSKETVNELELISPTENGHRHELHLEENLPSID